MTRFALTVHHAPTLRWPQCARDTQAHAYTPDDVLVWNAEERRRAM